MLCPKCNQETKVTKLKRCSHCNAELNVQGPKGAIDNKVEKEYHTLYKDVNVHIEATLSKEDYKVTFYRVMISDWIRCPSCHAKSFMNRMLVGKLQIKCRRCKALVDYEFKKE